MQTARSALAAVGVLSVIGLAHMGSAISATSADDGARKVAEEMAEAASKEFNAFETRQRVAQADTTKPGKTGAAPHPGEPWEWLQYSHERFQMLMRRLAGAQRPVQPWDPVAEAARKTGAEPSVKAGEVKADATPAAPAAASSQPAPVASAKPPAKTETSKSADAPKGAEPKGKAAEKKPAAEPATPPAPKTAEAPRGSGKDAPAKASEAPRTGALQAKRADAPKPAETPPAGVQSAKQDPAAKKPGAAPKVTSAPPASPPPAKPKAAAPAVPPAAKPEALTKSADDSKSVAPARKQTPAATQPGPAKEPSAGAKVAANEPTSARTDVPTGIPTDVKARPARSKAKRRARPRTAAACRAAGKRVRAGNWYTVREGDSLWRIARRHLGEGEKYRMLRAANRRSIADADHILPCQRIYIPRRGARRRG